MFYVVQFNVVSLQFRFSPLIYLSVITKYLQKYSKCNSLTIRITLLFSTKELYSKLSLGPVFLFWSVAYTQLFLKLFKFHLEPFKYRHSVNAQPELSFLLRIPLYCCRWICRSELLPVFPWIPLPGIARLSAASLLYLPALTCFHCLL